MSKETQVLFIENKSQVTIEFDSNVNVGSLIKTHVPDAASRSDDQEDYEVYVVGRDEELSKDKSFHDQKGKSHDLLLIHRCKKVSVKVVYAGKDFTDTYNVAQEFEHVLKKALHKFDIKGKEAGDFQLFLTEDQSQVINVSYPIGAYSSYPGCKLTVYLSKPRANQG